jgi:sigma-B regulation protein RsbU (phosphoserine phosphatase)
MRALIADDDRIATALLSRALADWQFDVSVAHDGEAAWELTRTLAPQLAIIDWMMSTLDGPDLCRRIRHDESHSHMHLILLSSRGSRADIIAGLSAGADDYLVKPFDPAELRARLHVGVRVLTLQERLADRVAELEAAVSAVKRLHGLLPICSYCKRVRNDGNDWEQLESYISEHTDAQFSHGICPPCLATAYAELKTRDA